MLIISKIAKLNCVIKRKWSSSRNKIPSKCFCSDLRIGCIFFLKACLFVYCNFIVYFYLCNIFFFQSLQPNRGATHLWKPLRAIHMLSCVTRPKNVFLFSDGHISDEVSTLAMIQKYQQSVRLFTFGLRFVYPWERILYVCSQWFFSFDVIKKFRYMSISIYQ